MEISHLSERQCCNSRMLRISTHFPSRVEASVTFIYDCTKNISPQPLRKAPHQKKEEGEILVDCPKFYKLWSILAQLPPQKTGSSLETITGNHCV